MRGRRSVVPAPGRRADPVGPGQGSSCSSVGRSFPVSSRDSVLAVREVSAASWSRVAPRRRRRSAAAGPPRRARRVRCRPHRQVADRQGSLQGGAVGPASREAGTSPGPSPGDRAAQPCGQRLRVGRAVLEPAGHRADVVGAADRADRDHRRLGTRAGRVAGLHQQHQPGPADRADTQPEPAPGGHEHPVGAVLHHRAQALHQHLVDAGQGCDGAVRVLVESRRRVGTGPAPTTVNPSTGTPSCKQ